MHTDETLAETRKGVFFALFAYTFWGIAPIYFKSLSPVPAYEVLSHRVIWSCLLLFIIVVSFGYVRRLITALRTPKTLLYLTLSSVLIGINWFVFIWSVNHDRMLEASLGYFINPLVNVLIGMVFLNERLRKNQYLAVSLAIIGVLVQLISFGSLPWIALVLAFSFGCYGLIRKQLQIDAITGLLLETLVLLPVALIYLFVFANSSSSNLTNNGLSLNLLLFAAGAITTIPLLFFAGAAKRLKLSTLGFFQYIGPSLMFILAVFVYEEHFNLDTLITFAFIWAALIIFSFDGLHQHKQSKRAKLNS
ncbi:MULTISPECIES: EamA family transporter RarD [unclassified Motilimonas]|uniref:EamA family transporter RarD n=1 Tax=Motilimonas TaxID=1914248 RepID=UPI001E52B8CE|nr:MULTISPECIES: EamA family transporter RarD [unclassified Motilimonas]MCE0559293.1 EamA family transporter RarD [Motilimonas sp. E26]MDO6524057.1 EamA family transporter RarD [Motilimonas sp. 1_MG-2023]